MTDRKIQRLSAIPTPYGNGSHLLVPRGWQNKRVYCLLHEEWDLVRESIKQAKMEITEVTAG